MASITHYVPAGTPVDVYWNRTRKCYSIREHRTSRVADYTDSIMIDNPQFIVNEAGRQRVLRTKQKNVHAWVSGTVRTYRSLISEQGLPPLGLFHYRDLMVRNVTYNPYKYNMFVRMDKPFEPVVLADQAYLSIWGHGRYRNPKMMVYRKDMWGEFTEAHKQCYDVLCDAGWVSVSRDSPYREIYDALERAGMLFSQSRDNNIEYFWNEQSVSSRNPAVVHFGPPFVSWGFFDRTGYFHIVPGANEQVAFEAYMLFQSRQR
jgi:hypothetical protein